LKTGITDTLDGNGDDMVRVGDENVHTEWDSESVSAVLRMTVVMNKVFNTFTAKIDHGQCVNYV
jgi:hypothetical protein